MCSATGTVLSAGDSFTIESDSYLVAVREPVGIARVLFVDGSTTVGTDTVYRGGELTLERSLGGDHVGWKDRESGEEYPVGGKVTVTSDIVFIAVWRSAEDATDATKATEPDGPTGEGDSDTGSEATDSDGKSVKVGRRTVTVGDVSSDFTVGYAQSKSNGGKLLPSVGVLGALAPSDVEEDPVPEDEGTSMVDLAIIAVVALGILALALVLRRTSDRGSDR
ncbi:MAG: hypothetical protein IJ856_05315 [Candidatus Methanomethylophilaceae archaeon]|nr:hypothetical protein [Candidatus Methanomethylophilaceae archaeon]